MYGRGVEENDPDHTIAYRMDNAMEEGEGYRIKPAVLISEEIPCGEKPFGKGSERLIRLAKNDFYYYLQIGVKDPEKPEVFSVQRSITLSEREFVATQELFNGLASSEGSSSSDPVLRIGEIIGKVDPTHERARRLIQATRNRHMSPNTTVDASSGEDQSHNPHAK